MLLLSAIVLHVVICVHGHRYGADPLACDTMKPGHGVNRRQTRATPFIIDTNLDGYVPCTTVGQRDCGVIGKFLLPIFKSCYVFLIVLCIDIV